MIRCHACGHKNIDGAIDCESCSVPLDAKPKSPLSIKIEQGTIAGLLPRKAILLKPADTVDKAVELMRKSRMGCVLVEEDGKVAGILAERDILFGVAGIQSPRGAKVRDVMHKDPVCLKDDDPVSFAFHHMSVGGYRHLPVCDEGKPLRMISARDLLRFLTDPAESS